MTHITKYYFQFLTYWFLIILVTLSTQIQAQNTEVFLGARFGHLDIENYNQRNYGGVELDVVFDNNLGMHYTILGGKGYFHMPVAPVVGFLLGLALTNDEPPTDSTESNNGLGLFIGILTSLIPEAISYTIPLSEQFSVAPYIAPLQFEYLKNVGDEEGDPYIGGGAGVKVHFFSMERRLRLSSYFEYKIHYNSPINKGYSAGLNIAWKINNN